MDFAHLHVASAYSLRHGASMSADLVARGIQFRLQRGGHRALDARGPRAATGSGGCGQRLLQFGEAALPIKLACLRHYSLGEEGLKRFPVWSGPHGAHVLVQLLTSLCALSEHLFTANFTATQLHLCAPEKVIEVVVCG